MSTIKVGWLNDKNGDKFAPKTLTSQVTNNEGVSLDILLENAGTGSDSDNLESHISDTTVHITSAERSQWNATLTEAKEYTDSSIANIQQFDNIEQKPFREKTVNITYSFAGKITHNDFFALSAYWYKIADILPTKEQLLKSKFTVDGIEKNFAAGNVYADSESCQIFLLGKEFGVFYDKEITVFYGDSTETFTVPSPGIYVSYLSNIIEESNDEYLISCPIYELLDSSIPNTVARTKDVAQANWFQTDSTKPDYIRNKPNIDMDRIHSDWLQHDQQYNDFIKNKPFFEEEVNIEWDGVLDGSEITGISNNNELTVTAFLVSKNIYTVDQLKLLTVQYTGQEGSINSSFYNIVKTEDIIQLNSYIADNEALIYIALKDNASYNNFIFPQKGMYFTTFTSTLGTHYTTTKLYGTILQKINEKFLPETVADKTYVDNIVINKVDKIEGKSLSTNDYTNEDKEMVNLFQAHWNDGSRLITQEEKQTLSELNEKAQSDYNQANKNEKDYIKNRPFYEDNLDILNITETFETLSEFGYDYSTANWVVENNLQLNRNYTIIFDDITYNCISKADGDDKIYVGNFYRFKELGGSSTEGLIDTEEPFILTQHILGYSIACIAFGDTINTEHSLQIILDDIKTIDEKFLPKDKLLPEVNTEDNGKIIKVVNGFWQLADDESGESSGGAAAISSWNDITDKPFETLSMSSEFSFADTESFITCQILNQLWCKFSDLTPSKNQLSNTVVNVSGNAMALNQFTTIMESDDLIVVSDGGNYLFSIVYKSGTITGEYQGVSITGTVPETGIYIALKNDPSNYTMTINVNYQEELIFESSIPESIARVSDIPEASEQIQADWDQTDSTKPDYIKNKPVISADGSASIQPNWNQSDNTQADYIKNRPFYDDSAVYYEYDGTSEPLESVDVSAVMGYTAYTYKISENPITKEQLLGSTMTMFQRGEFVDLELTSDLIIDGGTYLVVNIDSLFSVFEDSVINGLPVTPGVWTAVVPDAFYVSKIEKIDLKQIDEKFIPKAAKGIQSDWNDNDETSKRYILNRPFYSEGNEIIETFPRQTVHFENKQFTMELDESYLTMVNNNSLFEIFWDGQLYQCPIFELKLFDSPTFLIGNVYQILKEVGSGYLLPFVGHFEKTNEPFVIIINPPNVSVMNFSDITDVTISVSLINNGVHHIDKKYLPNIDWNSLKNKPFYDYSKKFEVPIQYIEFTDDSVALSLTEEQMLQLYQFNEEDLLNLKIKVLYDGGIYDTEFAIINDMPVFGNHNALLSGEIGNGEPFAGIFLGGDGIVLMSLDGKNNCEFGLIATLENIEKIPSKYLSKVDWNESDPESNSYIANKPFGIKNKCIYDEKLNFKQAITEDPLYLYALNNINVEADKDYIISLDGGITNTAVHSRDSEGIILISIGDYGDIMVTQGKGYLTQQTSNMVHLQIYEGSSLEYNKIPEEYLPENITGGASTSLPEVTTEDNGKFLQVVDGMWTAVSMTNGNEVAY